MIDQQKDKKTKAYRNSILLKKNSIKLERDGFKENLYYITFVYTSVQPFKANFYFNASHNMSNNRNNGSDSTPEQEIFIPTEKFADKTLSIMCEPGKEQEFSDRLICVDLNYLNENKIYDIQFFDLIIELVGTREDDKKGCVIVTLCKIVPEVKGEKTTYKIKAEQQKIKVCGYWFEMNDVYGISADLNRYYMSIIV